MEQGGPESIDKSKILEVKPLRCLSPVFTSASGSSVSNPQASSPFHCVPPGGPFPPGLAPIYPFMRSNESQRTGQPYGNDIASPVPLNAFRTPGSAKGGMGRGKRGRPRKVPVGVVGDSGGYSDLMNQSDQNVSGYDVHETDAEDASNSGKRKTRLQKRQSVPISDFDEVGVVNSLLTSFKLMELDIAKNDFGDRELVDRVLLVYDLLRKKIMLHDESRDSLPGVTRRPDLKAGNLLMSKGIRTNNTKKIGHVPGVEVGDIFFFRMELCVVGLHAPTMAGIDYMTVKASADEDPVALSIVSSGGYEDDGEDGDVLIYSGQGGVQRRDGLMFDQKLERGNLALEKSMQRGNEVRVIRGLKDINTTGKIYVYDGLYKIQDSWAETNKTGCNVFKYKLVRVPGQPEAFTLWKLIQRWKDGIASRTGVILPDLTSGAESLPVSLVNDVDDEKGPDYFTYIPTPKYAKPYVLPEPSLGCQCNGGCQPGDVRCSCIQKNMGCLPYNPLAVLMKYQSLIHECGKTCACPSTCRNRMTQVGLKVRLEVFKTKNRGWGLRSWDPIRGGGFICEYAGQVIDASKVGEFESENEDAYIFDSTRIFESLEDPQQNPNESPKAPFPLVINAKLEGNVARFMNHSCSPNVYWQPVLRASDNEAYLHVGFFAIKHIRPMQELTFDYGVLPAHRAQQRRKKCSCGSVKCRGYFY
ncbi:histone modifying enzyme [Lithospermum erythrorhizon]|uniref:Histone modifying enzyme n=1 Tax=Lithospermum erythrorhizon TaxID=34254 RepID=A0AAV3NJK3_LITER